MPRQLDDWVEGFLAYTDDTEPPKSYREWVAISVVAAALQRKCYLQWGRMEFYPNMYIVLVGPAGRCRKSTIISEGLSFLRRLGVPLASEATTRQALIQQLLRSVTQMTDSSGKLQMHSSLTIFASELAVFLGHANPELLTNLTDWYDCGPEFKYETISRGEEIVIAPWLNLLGGVTPEILQSTLPRDLVGGGLSSRIIFVYEENKAKPVAFPFLRDEQEELERKLRADLEEIHLLAGQFLPSKEFLHLWADWYISQHDKTLFGGNPYLQYYSERRSAHVMKLCLILAASTRETAEKKMLSRAILERAIATLERVEKKMPRVFQGYGAGKDSEVVSHVMSYIANRKQLTLRELHQSFYTELDDLDHLLKILKTLQHLQFADVRVVGSETQITYKKGQGFT